MPVLSPFSSSTRSISFPFSVQTSFNSIAWSQVFCTGILFDSFFPNTFFYFQNLLGTNFFNISLFLSFSTFFTSFSFSSCFLLPHIGGQHVIFTFPFSQFISRLWATSHGIPSITFVFPKLYTSILALSTCPLKNMLYSTWCVMAPPAFTVPSTFLTSRGFFSFSILNPFSQAKVVSMNRPVAPLSSSAFTVISSWLSSFSSTTFIQTSLGNHRVCCISLILSVVLVQFNLIFSFSGHNTLYRLLEAS